MTLPTKRVEWAEFVAIGKTRAFVRQLPWLLTKGVKPQPSGLNRRARRKVMALSR